MGSALKGMGAFRRELLMQIITRFGRKSFSFKEASTVPGFSRAAFMNLYTDGLLKKTSKSLPLRYSISAAPIKSRKEQNSPSEAVESEDVFITIPWEGGSLCSGLIQL